MSSKPPIDYSNPEENEPHLGIWWTVLMLVLVAIREIYPPEKYSIIWFLQVYVIFLCVLVVVFVIYKRRKYDKAVKARKEAEEKQDS